PRPRQQRLERRGQRQGPVRLAGVMVVLAVGLLPARRLDLAAVDHDAVVFRGVHGPEGFEALLAREQALGQAPDVEEVAVAEVVGREALVGPPRSANGRTARLLFLRHRRRPPLSEPGPAGFVLPARTQVYARRGTEFRGAAVQWRQRGRRAGGREMDEERLR